MKLRGFKRAYVRRVRLIQKHREFAEDGTRFRHPGDLNAFLFDRDRALLKEQQPAGCRARTEYGLTGLVGHEWKRGELPPDDAQIENEGRGHVRSCGHSKTNGSSLSIFWLGDTAR